MKIMPNAVNGIKFHKCKNPKYYRIWTRMIKQESYTVPANTKVCSNHFKYGQPYDDSHPTLYLTGYEETPKPERRELK